jgi:hypothetical protein
MTASGEPRGGIGSGLSEVETDASVAGVYLWFVTSQFEAKHVEAWDVVFLPDGVRHAKTYGTNLTRCGLNASSWSKFWERSFLQENSSTCCRECLQAMR